MSRPIVPRPFLGASSPASPTGTETPMSTASSGGGGAGIGMQSALPSHRPRKISTACGACKQRKTRCTGGNPCEACATRDSPCIYDLASDQRRKIANQKNVQDLAEAQSNLEKNRQLLGGMIATIRAGDFQATNDLITLIRTGVDLSQLAAHVRNACRASPAIQSTFNDIDFTIEGEDELPHPNQLLNNFATHAPIESRGSMSSTSGGEMPTNLTDPYKAQQKHGG